MVRSCDQRLVSEASSGLCQQRVDPAAFVHFAEIEAPRHFAKVGVDMLPRKEVVGADDLALEQRPDGLDAVRVQDEVADIFARAVIDAMVALVALKSGECAVLVRHDRRALGYVVANHVLHGALGQVRGNPGAQLATTLQEA